MRCGVSSVMVQGFLCPTLLNVGPAQEQVDEGRLGPLGHSDFSHWLLEKNPEL